MKFVETFVNVFRVPDLRRRVLFTLAMLAVYRIGGHIPTPGVNTEALQEYFKQAEGTALGMMDLFSGGQLSQLTIFALGIMPYITASIILQLLTVVFLTMRLVCTPWDRHLCVVVNPVSSVGQPVMPGS